MEPPWVLIVVSLLSSLQLGTLIVAWINRQRVARAERRLHASEEHNRRIEQSLRAAYRRLQQVERRIEGGGQNDHG